MDRKLPQTYEEALNVWSYAASRSESLENIAFNECLADSNLATVRFQALWTEILRLREENKELRREMKEDTGVIAVWRRRALDAEDYINELETKGPRF